MVIADWIRSRPALWDYHCDYCNMSWPGDRGPHHRRPVPTSLGGNSVLSPATVCNTIPRRVRNGRG